MWPDHAKGLLLPAFARLHVAWISVHVSVCILTIKISQWARVNFRSCRTCTCATSFYPGIEKNWKLIEDRTRPVERPGNGKQTWSRKTKRYFWLESSFRTFGNLDLKFAYAALYVTVLLFLCFCSGDISKQFSDADEFQAELAKVKFS